MVHGISRREFVAGVAAAAGGAAGVLAAAEGGLVTGAPAVQAAMRFGLVTYLWGQNWDVPTIIANCEKAGVLGVELRTQHRHGVEPSLGAAARAEIKKRFADSRVVLIGLGTNEKFDSPDPAALATSIEAAKSFITLSRDVGGSGVKVKPDSFQKDVPREKTIAQIGAALNQLGAFGAELGQQVRLEVHGTCCELPTIKAIMDIATHPNVGVCWNSNDEDLKGAGLEKNFDMVKGRLGATVHVRELDAGKYPYAQLMKLFVKAGYKGWVLLEGRGSPKDPVAALSQQRTAFEKMVTEARKA